MKDFKDQELNERILKRLTFKIYNAENENEKTHKCSDADMTRKIRNFIDEMVRSEVGE